MSIQLLIAETKDPYLRENLRRIKASIDSFVSGDLTIINGSGSGGGGPASTDGLPEGATNLYFTGARVFAELDGMGLTDIFAGFDSSGVFGGLSGFNIGPYGGEGFSHSVAPNNGAVYEFVHRRELNIRPLQDSPIETWSLVLNAVNVDPDSSGFDIGGSGNAAGVISNNISHIGTGNSGTLSFINNYFIIGNGVDPIDVGGISYSYGFGNVNAGVNITNSIQGYGFQFAVNASASFDPAAYVIGFYDNCNVACPVPGWTSANFSPSLSEITNNENYTGLNLNPLIPTFSGNAGFVGVGIFPNLGTFGTGSFTGVVISPNIAQVSDAVGLQVSMSNVTLAPGGYALAARFVGNVEIQGNVSSGSLNSYFSQELATGVFGVPLSTHYLISAPTLSNGSTITDADFIGVNTAMLMQIGDSCNVTTSLVGLCAMAFPAVVSIGAGSYVDHVAGGTFAISMDGGAGVGGVIDEVSLARVLGIPNGITTVNKLHGYKMDAPFGAIGTTEWGVYIAPAINNYMAGSLKVGDGADIVTVGTTLDIEGDTKLNGQVGFYGLAPVAQQASSGPQTAGVAYTAIEQTMIQEMYVALRAYGLLS